MDTSPVVSIICIAYNHEKFISQAIEGFLSQQTSFPIEIFIHDDCSTDRTVEIIKEYHAKFPKLIKPIYQSVNQYSLGKKITPIVYPLCKGKYIAMCEGDDYWIDPYKLQKQVDFLEANPEYSFCFTNAYNLMPDGELRDYLRRWKGNNLKEVYTIEDIMFENFVPTASLLFKNHLIKEFPPLFYKAFAGDWILNILNAMHGDIGYIDEITCVRRIHTGGIVSMKSELFRIQANINLINIANELLVYRYNEIAIKRLLKFHKMALDASLKEKRIEEAKTHINFCIRYGFFDKTFSRKELIRTYLQVYFPSFYSMFSFG